MLDPTHALAGAQRVPARTSPGQRRVLLVGAHGRLGWAVIERLAASGRIEHIGTLAHRHVHTAFRALVPMADDDAVISRFGADVAIVAFDRPRPGRARDAAWPDDEPAEAFVQPRPQDMVALARRLHAAGTRSLVVAMPHAPTLMSAALQQGLASLDEAQVASIGFEQLVVMRMAQRGGTDAEGTRASPPQRLANWMLSQLHWLVPRSEQPVRLTTVAQVAAALALLLPAAPKATRVLPGALIWQAAQTKDVEALMRAWLHGQVLPGIEPPPLPRM